MFKNLWKKTMSVLCSAAMAFALLPAVSQTAYAATAALTPGTYFDVDGIKYEALAVDPDTGIQVVYVVGLADESTAVKSGILNIPAMIEYQSTTFNVCGISQSAFRNCTSIQDLRIGDLCTGGLVSVSAFEGCTGLKVIHFLGRGGFLYTSQAGSKYFDGVPDGLKVVAHHDASIADLVEREYSTANLPVGSEVYCEINFNTGSVSKSAFVRMGYSVADKTAKREGTNVITTTLKASGLSALTSADVYNDSSSADPICTGSVPSLPSGKIAWAFTNDNGTTYAGADDYISSCGKAYASDDTELNYSTVSLKHTTIRYAKKAVSPAYTVTTASGKVLDNSLISVSYTDANGKSVSAGNLVDPGDYTITCSAATSALSGSCSTSFSIADTAISWARETGSDRYAAARAASSDATSLASEVDASLPSTDFYVLVNSDNYAACALADSLAGLLNCGVLTTGAKSVPSSTKVALAGASKSTVLMLGSTESLSSSVQDTLDEYVNMYARVTKSDDPATMASDVLSFIESCKNGTYEIDVEQDWGDAAMVISTEESSATFSALTWAYSNKAPVVFMDSDGKVSDAAATAINGCKSVVCVGGTQAQYSALKTQFSGMDVTQWAGASDEYEASESYTAKAVECGNSYDATAFAADGDYGVLSAAAATVGNTAGVLMLASDAKGNVFSTAQEHQYEIIAGRVYAARTDICEETYEELVRAWETSSADNLLFGSIAVTNKMTANGKAQTPKVTVKDSSGKTLTADADYTLSFINNATGNKVNANALVEAGTYTATATGTYKSTTDYGGVTTEYGYYKNYISCTFTIAQGKLPAVSGLKVKAGKKSLAASWTAMPSATSYQVSYKLSGATKWTIKTVKTNKLAVKKLKSKKKYQVKVCAKNAAGAGKWSATKTVKVK